MPRPLLPPSQLELSPDESLARHTYLRLGGPAAYFGTPRTIDQLQAMARWASDAGLPLRILGGGSNILVADEGVRAVVLSLRRACGQTELGDEGLVTAGAGVMLPALSRRAASADLGGLEFAIGIPGTVGGALQSNAGIGDRREIGPLVETVRVLRGAEIVTLGRDDLSFEYRNSNLRGSDDIALDATLRLERRAGSACLAEMTRLLEARQASQPTAERNAGSIFRNPPGDYAGRLIEAAGCKGLRAGGAEVSTLHANFIVHDGSATAVDVAQLMLLVQQRVFGRSGMHLVPEIEWWGDAAAPAVFARRR